MRANVVFIATYDTKGVESDYIKRRVEANGAGCETIDVGVGGTPTARPDVSLGQLCRGSGKSVQDIRAMPRGEAVAFASALVEKHIRRMYKEERIDAIIGIGGAGGTQIVTQAMRTLPFGLPKLVLSTLASGNTRWYLQESDIAMLPSVSDVAGLNSVTMPVFDRFAAIAAKAGQWYRADYPAHAARMRGGPSRIGMTMYGTTTKGVTAARQALEAAGYEALVFHASGAGGKSMEGFVRGGVINGILDMTIAEVGAFFAGGLHSAGPTRLDSLAEAGVPILLVPGAADTVVLPPMDSLPEKYKTGRVLNYHNPTMTTMRTNGEENRQIAGFIAEKLRRAKGPAKVLLPLGGLSSIDKPGEIFYAPGINEILFTELRKGLKGSGVEVMEDERHLNDAGFGARAAALLHEMMQQQTGKGGNGNG